MRKPARSALVVVVVAMLAGPVPSELGLANGLSAAKLVLVNQPKGKKPPPGKRRPPPRQPGGGDANRDVGKKSDSATGDDPGPIEHQPTDQGPETKPSPMAW